jgi:hypothetical protein
MKLLLILLKNHFIKIVPKTIAEKYLSKGNFILMMTKATKPKRFLKHTQLKKNRGILQICSTIYLYIECYEYANIIMVHIALMLCIEETTVRFVFFFSKDLNDTNANRVGH